MRNNVKNLITELNKVTMEPSVRTTILIPIKMRIAIDEIRRVKAKITNTHPATMNNTIVDLINKALKHDTTIY